MRNFFLLFIRNGGVLVFLFFEAICLLMVVQLNKKQNDIFSTSQSRYVGFVYDKANDLGQYIQLSSANDSLAAENARLYAELDNAKYITSLQEGSVFEETYQQRYNYIEARVISNTLKRSNNFLTIDKGSTAGIRKRMGVISNFGVVGIVTGVSKKYAAVMSILHTQSRISGGIKRNGYHGGVVWKGKDSRKVNLIDIPTHVKLVKGDTVQTTGYSSFFPEGIMIGTVDTFWVEPGNNSYEIDVNLNTDLGNVRYVSVINDLDKEELTKLKQEVGDE